MYSNLEVNLPIKASRERNMEMRSIAWSSFFQFKFHWWIYRWKICHLQIWGSLSFKFGGRLGDSCLFDSIWMSSDRKLAISIGFEFIFGYWHSGVFISHFSSSRDFWFESFRFAIGILGLAESLNANEWMKYQTPVEESRAKTRQAMTTLRPT